MSKITEKTAARQQKSQSHVIKPQIPKRGTKEYREWQYNHSPERKQIFNKRWPVTKAQRDQLASDFTSRNTITINLPFYLTNSNFGLARKKIIINNIRPVKNDGGSVFKLKKKKQERNLIDVMSYAPYKNPQFPIAPAMLDPNPPTELDWAEICGIKQAKETMKHPIPQYLLDIKSFKPTEKGYLELSIIPEPVIGWVDTEMLKFKPTDPFKYFMSLARKRSQELGLTYDLALKNKLMQARDDIPETAPRFDPSFIPNRPVATPKTGKTSHSSSAKSFVPAGYAEFAARKQAEAEIKRLKREQCALNDEANPYGAAQLLEEALHRPEYQQGIQTWKRQDYNPFFRQLTFIEQRQLLGEVHGDCSCDRSFLSKPSEIKISLDQAKKDMIFV